MCFTRIYGFIFCDPKVINSSTPLNTITSITSASLLTTTALKAMTQSGIFLVAVANPPSDFPIYYRKQTAYGFLIHYMDVSGGTDYHDFYYTTEFGTWKRTFGGTDHETIWQPLNVTATDWYFTPTSSGVANVTTVTEGWVNFNRFINAYPIDQEANGIVVVPYTWNNVLFFRFENLTNNHALVTSGTYKVRIWYYPNNQFG